MKPLFTLQYGSTAHRSYQAVFWAIFAAVVFLVPHVVDEFRIIQFSDSIVWMVAILGLNLIIGYSGQISLGHSAFVGLGAYTTAILVADHNWSYFATIPPVLVLCFIVGFLVGIPALRITGLYLALATLGLAVVFPTLVIKYGSLTGGANGKLVRNKLVPPSWTGIDPGNTEMWTYYVLVAFAVISFLVVRNLLKSRIGRSIVAVRDNQTGAAVCGVNVPLTKMITFGFSAAVAGIAGTMFAIHQPLVSGTDLGLNRAIFLIVGLVIGGVATLSGNVVGGLAIIFIPWYASDLGDGALGGAVLGGMLIILTFVMPGGFIAAVRWVRARIVQVRPRPVEPTGPVLDTLGPPILPEDQTEDLTNEDATTSRTIR